VHPRSRSSFHVCRGTGLHVPPPPPLPVSMQQDDRPASDFAWSMWAMMQEIADRERENVRYTRWERPDSGKAVGSILGIRANKPKPFLSIHTKLSLSHRRAMALSATPKTTQASLARETARSQGPAFSRLLQGGGRPVRAGGDRQGGVPIPNLRPPFQGPRPPASRASRGRCAVRFHMADDFDRTRDACSPFLAAAIAP